MPTYSKDENGNLKIEETTVMARTFSRQQIEEMIANTENIKATKVQEIADIDKSLVELNSLLEKCEELGVEPIL